MKTTKFWLATIATLLCSLTASAYDFNANGICYNITSETTVSVTYKDEVYNGNGGYYYNYYTKYSGSVVIPSTVTYGSKTYSVTSIGYSAFSYCSSLTSITIPESVTSIGYSAFSGTAWYNNQPDGVVYAGKVLYKYKGTMPENTSIEVKEGTVSINSDAFSYCSNLASITIPESVTSIGSYAFNNCSSLISITIPESVTSIGNAAFYGTAWYNNQPDGVVYAGKVLYKYKGTMPENTSIEVKEGTVSISPYAFSGCSSLTSITIPEGVTSIGEFAFYGCSSLTSITIPESVTNIGNYAFSECYNLTSITLPESLTSIEDYAFEGCSSLTAIILPEGVTSIGDSAFRGCSSLTSITIPESVTSIGSDAFRGCSSLTAVHIKDIASWCNISFSGYSSNPLYYAKNLYLNGELVTELTIPNTVTAIKYGAFDNCSSLTSITIPESVTTIGDHAFYNCSSLTSITIPESVTNIGGSAFYGCSSLTSITIPESVTSIGGSAFYGTAWYNNQPDGVVYAGKVLYKYKGTMPANTSIEIKEGTVSISPSAFEGCSGLTSIAIPESVTSIGGYAFEDCSSLRKVINLSGLDIRKGSSSHGYVAYYAEKVITPDDVIDKYCFRTSEESTHYLIAYYGNDSILNLPEDYHGDDYIIDAEAFADDTRIVSVNIPQTVGEIGASAFAGCSKLASVTIPRGVMSIGNNAFENCTSLAAIVIPQNMLTIGSKSFAGCSSLASVEFKEGVETIGKNAFANCTSLATLIFPESLTAIGDGAFKGCSGLKTILFSENIDAYGSNVFEGCDAVETMTVKGSVMPTVPSDKITSITLYSPVPLETAEFANKVYRNATVYVPQGSLERYQAASVWKNFWTIKEFDPTGIEQLTINNGQLTIYDLSGRKIEVEDLRELEKGVYIINGRKVLIND